MTQAPADLIHLSIAQGIATITLNRPAQRNALSVPMREALALAILQVRDDPATQALILTGAGSAFCAGGDLDAMQDRSLTGLAWRDRIRQVHRWLPELVNLEKPVIAAVNGPAYGAGLSLALCCDFVLAAEDARFCSAFARLGLTPDMAAAYLLPRIVGTLRAKELLLTGRSFDAEEARRLGIVLDVVPRPQLPARALAFAGRLTAASTTAIGLTKSMINQAHHLDLAAFCALEASAQALSRDSAYHADALDRFQAKQAPRFDWDALDRQP